MIWEMRERAKATMPLRYRLGACEDVDAVRKSRGGIDVGKSLHQM